MRQARLVIVALYLYFFDLINFDCGAKLVWIATVSISSLCGRLVVFLPLRYEDRKITVVRGQISTWPAKAY